MPSQYDQEGNKVNLKEITFPDFLEMVKEGASYWQK